MKKYDLIVVGGGIAGVCAATVAARRGLRVLLTEKTGVLGGALSNSLVYPFMKYKMKNKLLSDGIFTEIRKRKEAYKDISWECYKFVFDDMVTEAKADVLFHSNVYKAQTDGRNIKSVSVLTKSGTEEFEAKYFIDASGDGELIAMTKCDYQLGRESGGFCQPMTTCFRVGNVDIELFKKEKDMLQQKYKEYQNNGKISNPRENILVFYGLGNGVLHFNTTRVIKHNPVDSAEISQAEIIARKQVVEMISFFKENAKSFKNSYIAALPEHIGVRESRKLRGVHILTADEIKNCVHFEDTIALGNYEIDIHNPTGTGTQLYYFDEDEYYCIPYRSLQPKEYDNMLVAGRCVSATHEAHSAIRIMPICACMGEAAGIAAYVADKNGTGVNDINIKELQSLLRENGAQID